MVQNSNKQTTRALCTFFRKKDKSQSSPSGPLVILLASFRFFRKFLKIFADFPIFTLITVTPQRQITTGKNNDCDKLPPRSTAPRYLQENFLQETLFNILILRSCKICSVQGVELFRLYLQWWSTRTTVTDCLKNLSTYKYKICYPIYCLNKVRKSFC